MWNSASHPRQFSSTEVNIVFQLFYLDLRFEFICKLLLCNVAIRKIFFMSSLFTSTQAF